MPFRWSEMRYDISLAKVVAQNGPDKPSDWEKIAEDLSILFTSSGKPNAASVELKGQGCRERTERLLEKHNQSEIIAQKKSGTEEEVSELSQLLKDISTYRRDIKELKAKEKEKKTQKEKQDKEKAEEMRSAAMVGMTKRKKEGNLDVSSGSSREEDSNEDNYDRIAPTPSKRTKKSKKYKRTSKSSAVEMLSEKYARKAEIKEKELELRKMELEFQKQKYYYEAKLREARAEVELEEKRALLSLFQNKQ